MANLRFFNEATEYYILKEFREEHLESPPFNHSNGRKNAQVEAKRQAPRICIWQKE